MSSLLLIAAVTLQNPVTPKPIARDIPAIASAREVPYVVRVLVINYDPIVEWQGRRVRLHEAGNWNDPRDLAKGYAEDVKKASGGYIEFKIIDWRDVDDFPAKVDGFRYTEQSYLTAMRDGRGWHEPDELDYLLMAKTNGLTSLINAGKIDEVWLFGAPYFGYWESAMIGPDAFYINGGVYPDSSFHRPFAVMGFNYERGVAEMLHDLCHRTESTMSRFFGGWKVEELTTPWAHFAANEIQSGVAAVGTCHYPPNAEKDYDYANKRYVLSSANDWLNWPKLTGKKERLNCEAWGGPDYHRNYMVWWFTRLPKSPGLDTDGRPLNWWKYVFRYLEFGDDGKRIR
jgi:hypothetical protein